ncbi:MAG TPA: 23S rRNA (pseudouridine(1915)-N(3))-methyltransferase RlmH [Solirubrobacterales bacterium]|nr:23S rRNA (pseudouridine(1915)-N(3))-methyltransferase RlmH [Solirubrobacterales bacterium]
MKATLICVGRTREPFLEAEAHYLKLLRRHLSLEVVVARDDQDLVARIPGRAWVVALDEGGRPRSSPEWAKWLEQRRLDGLDLCFLAGGQTGLPAAALAAARERVSFGPQTMAHQLARVVLYEQLFRAGKIAAGERYHC